MSLPTTVTNRAQGNNYVGATGMEFAVQTGFCIRTGFYITNSGSDTMLMSLSTPNPYDAFEFISGINEEVVITPGATKFIPFNFKGIKDASGPANISGPEGVGNYTAYADLSFVSEAERILDTTEDLIYPGQPRDGVIRVNLTGYVTGYYGRTDEFIPAHPEKFLGITGLRDDRGKGRNQLQWVNPATGYYFERYRLESGVGDTSNWSLVDYIEVPNVPFSQSINGTQVTLSLYGDCTGINGANVYNHTGLAFATDYYYRIRGEHYANQNYGYAPISYSDWVYCSGVSDFNQNVSNDVLTGLVSGSSDLPAGGDPSKLKLSTTTKGAMEIYLEHNEEYRVINGEVFSDLNDNGRGVSLADRFNKEMSDRYIDDSEFFDLFTGVHFIMPENINIGSSFEGYAGITVDYKEIASQELPVNLYIRDGACIMGKGGKGGDGGVANVKANLNVAGDITKQLSIDPPLNTAGTNSTAGYVGSNAMDIESDVSKFKIFISNQPCIYGGGGGGGGGDRIFSAKAALIIRQAYNLYKKTAGEDPDASFISQSILKQVEDLETDVDGNALDISETVLEFPLISEEESDDPQTDQVEFDLEQVLGAHQGGIGGGGQSFAIAAGGNKITFENVLLNNNVISESTLGIYLNSQGTIDGAGLGESLNANAKVSAGGNGGEWGQYGNTAPDSTFFGPRDLDSLNVAEEKGKEGGAGGYAIYVQGGSNFTKSNFKEKLFDFVYDVAPSEIEGFLARWDAGADDTQTTIKKQSDGADADSNAQEINRWNVTEWNNSNLSSEPYLDAPNVASIYPKFYTSTISLALFDRIRGFNNYNCIEFNGGQYLRFQNLCYGATANGLHNNLDGFELFYVIWPVSYGGANPSTNYPANFEWHTYERLVYQSKIVGANPITFTSDRISDTVRTLHKFSSEGKANSYFYNMQNNPIGKGYIYESAGLSVNNVDFMKFKPDLEQFYINQSVGLGDKNTWLAPAGAFIYNVSAERLNTNSFYYTVGQNENIQGKIINTNSLKFDADGSSAYAEARLGKIDGMSSKAYFCISDIIVYNRKLTAAERLNVKNFLKKKAFHPYYLDNNMNNNINYRAGTPQQNNNKIRDGRGFAGLIRFNN